MYKQEHPLSDKTAAFNSKLAEKYSDSLEVRQIISPVIVDLQDERGRWGRHIYVKDLKPTPNDGQHGPTPANDEGDGDLVRSR